MNIAELYAEAEKIEDPIERQKKLDEISRLVINPNRSATTMPFGLGQRQDAAISEEDYQKLLSDVGLTKKLEGGQRLEAFSDDELDSLVEGFSSTIPQEAAKIEEQKREKIDNQSLFENLANPDALTRYAGQVVGGAAEIPTSMPISLLGLMGKGLEFVTQEPLLRDGQGNPYLTADDILRVGANIREGVRSDVGISEPRNVSESIANIIPNLIGVPGIGAPTSTLGNVAEIVTPLVIGSGNGRILANFATAFAGEQIMRELADEADDEYKTIFDISGMTNEEDTAWPKLVATLGAGLGLLSTASIIAPSVVRSMHKQRVPKLKDIVEIDLSGPKDLKTLEKAGDLAKTYFVDEKSVLSGLARRAGMPDIDKIDKLIDHDTQMAATMRVNEAMRSGRLRTTTGNFEVDVTPNQLLQSYRRLPKVMQEDADKYVKFLDLSDDLKLKIARGKDVDTARQQLKSVQEAIYQIENKTPVVKEFASKYRSITGAVRRFLSEGPNAMLSKKALQGLDKERANYVPIDILAVNPNENLLARLSDASGNIDRRRIDDWYLQNRDIENISTITGRANAFETLHDYTRSALKAKMENDVRGAYIRGMEESIYGGQTIRKVTDKEKGKYLDRVVEVYNNGKKQQYLSSKLQRELLQFDPYTAKYPNAYSLKRIFEHGTTGPLSITFAPITALRDSIGGWVFMPKNQKGPGSLAVATAIPKQVWAKTQLAAIDILRSSLDDLPFLPGKSREALANQISSSYMNSMYHLASDAGGFDASLMRTNIENARGVFNEIAKATNASLPQQVRTGGRSLAVLAHGFKNIFNAIQEAPRFAAFERNVKAGMDPSDAVKAARLITGDTTRSGRVYTPRGSKIDADAVNKGMKFPVQTFGSATEFLRETTPYFNPMVQGMRRMGNAFIDDPIKTNLRAWAAVGLPAMVGMGWNEMLGPEYNKYAFEQRTSRDIAMNLYFGIPGKPPEEGIQIPIPHELLLFNSPWTTGIYSLMKGDDTGEVNRMMMHMAGESLDNSAMVGMPQAVAVGGAMLGFSTPQSINPFTWTDDTYELREDNVGVLPQNVEQTIRSLFGSISDTAMRSAAAFHDGGPEAFFDEFGTQVRRKLPIVKNIAGDTTSVTAFTPTSQLRETKIDALSQFLDLYEEHVDPRREGKTRISPPGSTKGLLEDDDAEERTIAMLSPHLSVAPTNQLYYEYGDYIKSKLDNNDIGYTNLKSHYNTVRDQLRLLKGYNAGKKTAFREWQRSYEGKDEEYQQALRELEAKKGELGKREYKKQQKEIDKTLGEFAKADRLVKELNLDLGKRSDVNKLINHLERERLSLMQRQLAVIKMIEDDLTLELRQKGLLKPDQNFTLEKHLKPNLSLQ